MNPVIQARDALYQAEMTVNALEGIETLVLCGDGNGDMQMVKVDHFASLLYLLRTTLRQQLEAVDQILAAASSIKPL